LVFGPEVVSSLVTLIPSMSAVPPKYAFEILEELASYGNLLSVFTRIISQCIHR
jgi:hypothetical protein